MCCQKKIKKNTVNRLQQPLCLLTRLRKQSLALMTGFSPFLHLAGFSFCAEMFVLGDILKKKIIVIKLLWRGYLAFISPTGHLRSLLLSKLPRGYKYM